MVRLIPRRPWLIALAAFVALALAVVLVPVINDHLVQGRMTRVLSNALQLHLAIQTRSLDEFENGEEPRTGLPFDVGAKTAREYLEFLTTGRYLAGGDVDKLLAGLTLTNASRDDPPKTALIVSDPFDPLKQPFIAFSITGKPSAFKVTLFESLTGRPNHRAAVQLPPRTPPVLPAR